MDSPFNLFWNLGVGSGGERVCRGRDRELLPLKLEEKEDVGGEGRIVKN
jgi:hypothetical protein